MSAFSLFCFSAVSLHNCKIAQYSTISHCNGATSVCICISTNNLLVFVVVLTRMALREAIKNYLADFFCVCEKNHISALVSLKTFFSIQTLFSLYTKLLFWDTTGPPQKLKIAKCLFFVSFQESHFRSDLHEECHPEQF